MNETRQLARFVTATSFSDIPPDVVEHAKVFILDNFACGLIGSVQPWSNMVADLTQEGGGTPECTVFGKTWRGNASGSALVNGVMIGALESEHADPIGVHPGGNVFPALMAIAEREHANGKDFITALVLGYEAIVRIGEAATRSVEDERGFHTPSTNGPFGAAVAVAKVLGFDEATLTHALGIAGAHCAGVIEFKWEGAMTKRLHLGRGGQMGLESALLAAKGFTGPSTILEGKFGYFNVYAASTRPERLLQDIGTVWFGKTLQFIKPFSCHGTQQAVVYNLYEYQKKNKIDPQEITKVLISGSKHMMNTHQDREPKSIMGAQYSMPFVVAIALAKDIADPYIFNEETLWDDKIRALAKLVETRVDPRLDAFDTHHDPHAEIVIETGNKRHFIAARGYKGLPSTPFDFNDVCGKFRRYGAPVIGTDRVEEAIEKVRHLEDLPDVAKLVGLMAPSPT